MDEFESRLKSAEQNAKEAKDMAANVHSDLKEMSSSMKAMAENFSDMKESVKIAMANISNTFEKMTNIHTELQVMSHDHRAKDNHNREEHSRIEGRINELKDLHKSDVKSLSDRMDLAKVEETHLTVMSLDSWFKLVGKLIVTTIVLAFLGLIFANK